MRRATRSEMETASALIALNESFRSRVALPGKFYELFEAEGYLLEKCVLFDCFPDSANTYFGHFISHDGRVVEFSADLDCPECSTWEDVTESFLDDKGKSRAKRTEVDIALRLFDGI